MDIVIRNETQADHQIVENLTREAFWNLNVPGCDEHYLVHIMRSHADFITELDFVAMVDGKIVGNIMYTRSAVIDESDREVETLTFGPLSVLPEYQRKGVGTALIDHTRKILIEQGCPAVIIYGDIHNYSKHGFKSSRDFNITNAQGKYPFGLLVMELKDGVFSDHQWRFVESKVFEYNPEDAEEFDKQFPPKTKEYRHTQTEFMMAIRAYIE
jgi:putative acetyltransferase